MDDDDEEGSRGIPSRTRIGKKAALIEKFPYLGNDRFIFGFRFPEYAYNETPLAKLDVMISDLPHVEYDKKKDPKNEKITQNKIDEAYKKSLEMREKLKSGGLGLDLGKQINMNHFIAKAKMESAKMK